MTFRVDASTDMGTGHVMRCLTLAQGLKTFDVSSRFVCREHEGNLCGLIEERGFAVARLPRVAPSSGVLDGPAYAPWLGVDWRVDLQQTRATISEQGAVPEWLIIDHYGIDHRWETRMREATRRIMVIDDLADRVHDCDTLLDQNLVKQMELRYLDKVPNGSATLLGPEYALLHPIYAELRQQVKPRSGPVRRVLITFGGADRDNLTGRALAAFLRLGRSDMAADVVIANSMTHAAAISEQAAQHDNVRVHVGLPTLAHLIAGADVAIGAAGITSWERLCLGLPTLVITIANNQLPSAARLHQDGLIRWLGDGRDVDQAMLTAALSELARTGLDPQWSMRCLAAVDGQGLQRVCTALTAKADTPLRVRHATAADEHQLLIWANEPATRRNAFSIAPIRAEVHHQWFCGRLETPDACRIFIAESETGMPVGQVRFDRTERSWVISYSLDVAFRGRGRGRQLVQAALAAFAAERPDSAVTARVKASNHRSCRIFDGLAFCVIANDGDVIEYQRAMTLPEQ